jgi:UDP-N-acetylglucosamine--N-acetylmuramyl-(pentapeptide) pyrophosphoryl-undecaprenol N-acetylglucosamine transferase
VRVVVAGGGTAGHIFPALALADRLTHDHGVTVEFVGSPRGQEAMLVPAAGYEFHPVDAAQLVREVSIRAAKAPLVALRSVQACRSIVQGAAAVVGMGGYVSVPAAVAARRMHVPVVLHEQNAIPGLANRLLARGARAVGIAFEDARTRFPGRARVVLTGNPVRDAIVEDPLRREALAVEARETLGLEPGRRTVVVFGGSQGALRLDRAVADSIRRPELHGRGDLQLLVLAGPAHVDVFPGSDVEHGALLVRVLPFLDRMELACAVGDLALSRAGAGHIAELTVCGIPSILVPYPHATAKHQEANARELERAGAAQLLLEAELSAEVVAARMLRLVDDADLLRKMASRATAWGRPDAAERLASLVMEEAQL